MRSEDDNGDNEKKRFAVNIPAPRKILTKGEPMELDTSATLFICIPCVRRMGRCDENSLIMMLA